MQPVLLVRISCKGGPDFPPMDIRKRKWVENNKNRLGNDKTDTI